MQSKNKYETYELLSNEFCINYARKQKKTYLYRNIKSKEFYKKMK